MKQFFVWPLVSAMFLLLCGCGAQPPEHVQSVDTAMDTVIQQNLYLKKNKSDFTEEVMELIRGLEEDTLSWRLETSEVYRVNQAAGSGEGVELSEGLSQVMEKCLELTKNSGGAFDVTLGQIAVLWDIDNWSSGLRQGEFEVPDEQAVAQALALCGSSRLHVESHISMEGDVRLILHPEEGVMLDLGSVGKGLALDYILKLLEEKKAVSGGIVSTGITYTFRLMCCQSHHVAW